MRGYLPDYRLGSAKKLEEAFNFLENGARPFAGGTDIMVLMDSGILPPGEYFDILNLKELRGIKLRKDEVHLGALSTYSEIRDHQLIQKHFPILVQSAREVGAIAIQNRGTLGGNIANASPAADFPPGLLVYDAKINLLSSQGIRNLDYNNFHLGYKKSELQPNELIHSIILKPHFLKYRHFWRKVGSRQAQAISKTMIAAVAKVNKKKIEDIKIAYGSVAPTAVRCSHVEFFLLGKTLNSKIISEAKNILVKDIQPIDDIRSTGKYRLVASQNVLEEFLCGIG